LGQNFAKMFNIRFLDESNKSQLVVQNSWGFTTRSIGVMVMNHSDDDGLVLPPRVAQWQVVIIPIPDKKHEKLQDDLNKKAVEIRDVLTEAGIRAFVDDRDIKKAGYKYNEWEMKGVPVRLELGPKDFDKKQVVAARRDEKVNGRAVKTFHKWDDIAKDMQKLLEDIQQNLLVKATKALHENIVKGATWDELIKLLSEGKLALVPHCNDSNCEEEVGKDTKMHFEKHAEELGAEQLGKAKALCMPLEQPSELPDQNTKCIKCGNAAKKWVLFGRSY